MARENNWKYSRTSALQCCKGKVCYGDETTPWVAVLGLEPRNNILVFYGCLEAI